MAMIARAALGAILAAAILTLPACSLSAERQVLSGAYEACKARTGDSRDRCIAAERERLRLQQAKANDACLEEIARQDDRAAMIDGRRTPDPNTEAASSLCGLLTSQP